MALHPSFPLSPYDELEPAHRWFPADEALRESAYERLVPPLVAQIRAEVKAWRDGGYLDATPTSRALLRWWFDSDHEVEGSDGTRTVFRYYFSQREAVETVIWLHDVRRAHDKFDLMRFDASGAVSAGMFDEDWPRYVLKMATGAGKTKVLSLLIAWCWFHRLYEPDSALARNFLLIAPNIIVLDRLRADFDGLRIFFEDPVLPDNGHAGRNWRDDFQLSLHLQDDVRVVRDVGNLFLTNIHRVYLGDVREPTLDDDDLSDYFLSPFGPKPVGKTTDSKTDLGEIVREIDELAVFNDEAHHIHDPRMAWFGSIRDIHHRMLHKDRRLALQVDVSATPRHNNGAIFVQTVSDYPLVEAIHQGVVKHPVLPDAASRARLHEHPSAIFHEKFADDLALGVEEWRNSFEQHQRLGKKAVLFVMVDDTRNCDGVGAHLERIAPELQGAVLVIHTKNNGEISESASGKAKEELEALRREANRIDSWGSPYKAIVSVLMLKEGWDVRNVTTIVGLRVDALDITLPRLARRFQREYKDLDALDVDAIGGQRLKRIAFTPEQTREIVFKTLLDGEAHHTVELDGSGGGDGRSVVAFFARQVMREMRLVSGYEILYGKVKTFVREHLFEGAAIELDDPVALRNLAEPAAAKRVFDGFKTAINALTVRDSGNARIEDRIRLRDVRPFRTQHRDYLSARKSLFNRIVGEPGAGGFELRFARFLDDAADVQAFAKNYLALGFKIDYVKTDGDLSTYTPDFIVKDAQGTVWIIETKGREELDLPRKMARLAQWCADATAASRAEGGPAYRFVYVDQAGFERHGPKSLAELATMFREYQGA